MILKLKKRFVKYSTSILTLLTICACDNQTIPDDVTQTSSESMIKNSINYPITTKKNVIDTYFDTPVTDPYRWLEDDMSEETEDWVTAQNKVTFEYLNNIPSRDKLKKRLAQLLEIILRKSKS